jgi:hypothetical protein
MDKDMEVTLAVKYESVLYSSGDFLRERRFAFPAKIILILVARTVPEGEGPGADEHDEGQDDEAVHKQA